MLLPDCKIRLRRRRMALDLTVEFSEKHLLREHPDEALVEGLVRHRLHARQFRRGRSQLFAVCPVQAHTPSGCATSAPLRPARSRATAAARRSRSSPTPPGRSGGQCCTVSTSTESAAVSTKRVWTSSTNSAFGCCTPFSPTAGGRPAAAPTCGAISPAGPGPRSPIRDGHAARPGGAARADGPRRHREPGDSGRPAAGAWPTHSLLRTPRVVAPCAALGDPQRTA